MKNELTVPEFDYSDIYFGAPGYDARILTNEDNVLMGLYDLQIYHQQKVGDVITLVYYGETPEHFLFEGDLKDFVRVDNKPNEARLIETMNIGDSVDVIITDTLEKPYMIKGSVALVFTNKVHDELATFDGNQFVNGVIKSMTPAGFSVVFTHMGVDLNAFMPNTLAGINRLLSPEKLVGKTLELAIESFSEDEGTYIVSRRKYLQSLIPEAIGNLVKGDLLVGLVTGTADFGVFVEFNECLTGMIHKSNLNPDNNNTIADIKPGNWIEFYVKEIFGKKIMLTQVLYETLWDTIENGQKISGIVKDNNKVGTLVMLDGETTGLISLDDVIRSGRTFKSGETLNLRIKNVDRMARKITLMLA
jgi:ribosomal protein S1